MTPFCDCCCRPRFRKFDSLQARYAEEKANITKNTCPVVDPYRPLLALPQKAGSFKFKLACIGGESEWKIISSKAGAGYFGHNEFKGVLHLLPQKASK